MFEVVAEFDPEMFQADMALYPEMLSDNYHIADIVGVAWGNKKIYVTDNLAVFENQDFCNWLSKQNNKKVYDAKRTYVA